MTTNQSKLKLQINTQKEIEELELRLRLCENDTTLKLGLLIAFRPGATLRQLNNVRRANFLNLK